MEYSKIRNRRDGSKLHEMGPHFGSFWVPILTHFWIPILDYFGYPFWSILDPDFGSIWGSRFWIRKMQILMGIGVQNGDPKSIKIGIQNWSKWVPKMIQNRDPKMSQNGDPKLIQNRGLTLIPVLNACSSISSTRNTGIGVKYWNKR